MPQRQVRRVAMPLPEVASHVPCLQLWARQRRLGRLSEVSTLRSLAGSGELRLSSVIIVHDRTTLACRPEAVVRCAVTPWESAS